MGRDNKKGRGGGGGRGSGKKMFIANIEEMEMRNREAVEHQQERARRRAGSDAEDEPAGGAAEESGSDEEGAPKGDTVFGFQRQSRAEATAARKAAGSGDDNEDDEEEESPKGLLGGGAVNPNRQPKPAERMIKIKNLDSTEGTATAEAGMNRKEREALAAQKAKEDYMKRHMAGETEQARADLARLAIVRKRREEAAAKRAAEGRAPGWSKEGIESNSDSDSDSDDEEVKGKGPAKTSSKAPVNAAAAAHAAAQAESAASVAAKKKAAALAEEPKEAGLPKLSSMEIKKMNGDALKENLKARNLDVQGQKKDLMKRLQDYENAR